MSPTVTLWQCLSAITLSAAPARLARVDGFDQDKAESKRDERAVILRRPSKCDTLEALELADRLFDACPRLVKCFGKKAGMSVWSFAAAGVTDYLLFVVSGFIFMVVALLTKHQNNGGPRSTVIPSSVDVMGFRHLAGPT